MSTRLLFYILFVASTLVQSNKVNSQDVGNVDSLQQALATASPRDSLTIIPPLMMARVNGAPWLGLPLGKQMMASARRQRDTAALIEGAWNTGMIYGLLGHPDSVTLLHDEVMPLVELPYYDTLANWREYLLDQRARTLSTLGNYREALAIYRSRLPMAFEDRDRYYVLHNLVNTFAALEQYDSAFHYAEPVMTRFAQDKDWGRVAMLNGTVASMYEATGEPQRALELYQENAVIWREHFPVPRMGTYTKIDICRLSLEMDSDSTLYYCRAGFLETAQLQDYASQADAAAYLADYYARPATGNQDSVLYYERLAYELSTETRTPGQFIERAVDYAATLREFNQTDRAYRVLDDAKIWYYENGGGLQAGDRVPQLFLDLAELEFTSNRMDSATLHYRTGLVMLRELYERRSEQNTADARARFELSEADFALAEARAARQLVEERATAQRNLFLGIGGGLVLLFAGGLFAYQRLRRSEAALSARGEELSAALTEREVLLKEIHHRVKNNLQIISGLLFRQSRKTESAETRELLRDGNDRIKAMALVHQNLYQHDELSGINLRDFTTELTEQLQLSQLGAGAKPQIELEVADARMNLDHAIPVGLMLNELITNAFKYALGPGGGDKLKVLFRTTAEDAGRYWLTVVDNGPGLPSGYSPEQGKSLGLHLVKGLTRQLKGKLELSEANGGGLRVDIWFAG